MYEFPLIEADHLLTAEELLTHKLSALPGELTLHPTPVDFTHILSHRKIHVRFFQIETNELKKTNHESIIVTTEELHHFPLPRVITRYLEC